MPTRLIRTCAAVALILFTFAFSVRADVITETTARTTALIAASGLPTPLGNRALAISQTAVYEAVNAITKKYPTGKLQLAAEPGASIEAAVAAANRGVLLQLIPAKKDEIESEFQRVIATVRDGPAKASGIKLGEQAAAEYLRRS